MSGFQNETRIKGVVGASDYDSVNNVLPNLAALVDAFCGNKKSAEVTETFTRHVDMVNL